MSDRKQRKEDTRQKLDALRKKVKEQKQSKKETEENPKGTNEPQKETNNKPKTEADLKKLSVQQLRRIIVDNNLFSGISRLRKAELIKKIMNTDWFKGSSKQKEEEEKKEDIEEGLEEIDEDEKALLTQSEEKEKVEKQKSTSVATKIPPIPRTKPPSIPRREPPPLPSSMPPPMPTSKTEETQEEKMKEYKRLERERELRDLFYDEELLLRKLRKELFGEEKEKLRFISTPEEGAFNVKILEERDEKTPYPESLTDEGEFNPKYIFQYHIFFNRVSIKYSQLNCFIHLDIYFNQFTGIMSYVYLNIFSSRRDFNLPRTPKGLSYKYLCQLIQFFVKGDDLFKLLKLESGNISFGRRDIKHNLKTLRNYYKKLGFRPYTYRSNVYMGQRISNFLNLCHNKFSDVIEQVIDEKKVLCDSKYIMDLSDNLVKKIRYEQEPNRPEAENIQIDATMFFYNYLDALKLCSNMSVWQKPLDDVFNAYDDYDNSRSNIPHTIFTCKFSSLNMFNKFLKEYFDIDDIYALDKMLKDKTAPYWFVAMTNNKLNGIEYFNDLYG